MKIMLPGIPYDLQNFIGGNLVEPSSKKYLDNINPATGEVYCRVPDSNSNDVDSAVAAANNAFDSWRSKPVEERFIILNRIAELIDENLEELATAETNDTGKPIWLSRRMDIPRASSNFRFFAGAMMHFASESHVMEDKAVNYTLRQPIGVAGCISPWNLPLYLFTWKIAPALAAGNTVVAKPSEITPVTAYLLGHICRQAGLPPGVLNIVHGSGNDCGESIVKHPKIGAVSFTGSTRAGKRIAGIAAPMFKKVSLELGGKNPAIIFADCDWEKMMTDTLRSSFTNQGEICLCGSRILIEKKVYEKFRKEFVARVREMKIGDPLLEDSMQGALVSRAHFEKVMNCIETARNENGKILTGGNTVEVKGRCRNGFFIEPTVIEGLSADCSTNKEEIFGPVVTLQSFESEEDALQKANFTDYGLAATLWTQDVSRANRMAARIDSGIIWVNCWLLRDLRTPFGGMKNSGVGREGGWEALRFFTEPKNVCIQL